MGNELSSSGVSARSMPGASKATAGGVNITRRLFRLAKADELAFVGGAFLLLVVLGAIFAPFLTPYSPTEIDIANRLRAPSLVHPFGTDEFGRDLLTRILFGARPIFIAGFVSVFAAVLFGMVIGTISAYWGGKVDEILMRLMDVVLSFPAILLAILIVAALGSGLINSIIAIAFSMIPIFARLVRSIVVTLVRQDYVLAARAIGASNLGIIRNHIVPNMLPPVLVQATAMLAVAFSTASALNFLGLGVEPPTPDWGLMISEGQRLVFDAPHVPFFPGVAIALTILSVNFIGDGLYDHLDPVLKNR